MNSLETYNALITRYFGNGTARCDTGRTASNHVIGALNHAQFECFKTAFQKRIERLSARYKGNHGLPHLLSAVNEVGSERNWEGAYAELVAIDFLNANTDYLTQPISLSRTVPASETLAGDMGMKNVNFDGYFDDFGISFDVKVLSDKSRNILDGIISQVVKQLGLSRTTIQPEYPLDEDFVLFEQNRPALYNELLNAISNDAKAKPTHIRSTILPPLSYRMIWGSGVLTTVSTYDPFRHAATHHRLLFKHAKKFAKTSPCLIVFVIFPWFSEKLADISGSNEEFYRAFCRRFFCQYAKDNRSATTVIKGIRGEITISEVTSSLSGVLFLEDHSITTSTPDEQNVKAFAYLNPNASHRVNRFSRCYLKTHRVWIDDFENDNY